jgi:hypothetical protein
MEASEATEGTASGAGVVRPAAAPAAGGGDDADASDAPLPAADGADPKADELAAAPVGGASADAETIGESGEQPATAAAAEARVDNAVANGEIEAER